MVDMKKQASCCTFVAVSEAESCKLPLLDGEKDGSTNFITTELVLRSVEDIMSAHRHDKTLLYSTACTAWGLLLRCYTGQDRVTFQYKNNNISAAASLLRTDFDEEESLSMYTEEAKHAITCIEHDSLLTTSSTIPVGSQRASLVNTAVCICDYDCSDGTVAAKAASEKLMVSDKTHSCEARISAGLTDRLGTCHISREDRQ